MRRRRGVDEADGGKEPARGWHEMEGVGQGDEMTQEIDSASNHLHTIAVAAS